MNQLFFFGSLRDKTLLEVVLDRPVDDADIVGAHAPGHAALALRDEAYPHLAETEGARAEGVVVSGLNEADLDRLTYFEEAEYGLAPITVETPAGTVTARYFQATGKAPATDGPWDYARWHKEDRAVAIAAAEELMAHKEITPVEDIDTIWPGVMIRAHMRARARAEAPVPPVLKTPRPPEDVEVLNVERPYTHFFAIEDMTLRHRRFDGSWSPPLKRMALTSGDAVTVLPYDPRSRMVLLIEQFRVPIVARGGGNPWVVEVVAGRIDRELDAETCARREAMEEAGLTLGRMEQVAAFYPTPGFAAEHVTSFVAEADLSGRGGLHGASSEDEDIRAFTVSLDAALEAVATGEIDTAPAIMSLIWLERHADRLATAWRAAS